MTDRALPPGWIAVELGDVGKWVGGGTPSKDNPQYWAAGTVPWVSPKDMKRATLFEAEDSITDIAVRESATRIVPAGSILIVTRSGILRHTIPVATAGVPVALNQDLKAVTTHDGFDASYVAWAIRAFESCILQECSKAGTTVQSLETAKLQRFRIPVAPIGEQHRIVAALEEHLSELDGARAWLSRVRVKADRWRAALFQAVVRRAEQNTRGPGLPIGELVLSLDQGWSPKCDFSAAEGSDWGVIKTTAIQPMQFDRMENKRLPPQLTPRAKHCLLAGDVLVTRAGPRNRVGVTCVVPNDEPRLMNCDKVYRLRVDESSILPPFLAAVLNAPSYLDCLNALKTGISDSGVNLTQDRFLQVRVPVPGMAHQRAAVQQISESASASARLMLEIDHQLAYADRLRKSILRYAFVGKLAPQDPVDERCQSDLNVFRGSIRSRRS